MFGSMKVPKKKNVKESCLIIFSFIMKIMKENQI